MRADVQFEQRNWLFAGGGALVVILVVLVLFHAPADSTGPRNAVEVLPAIVGFRPLNAADMSVDLLDPTPLFLPTKWNARADTAFEATREPGSAFGSYPARMNFHEDAINLSFPAVIEVPKNLVETLEVGPPLVAFTGMGRSERKVASLIVRDAFIEISSENNGHQVFRQRVAGARPPADADWQPFEFLVVIQSSGLVGQPTVVGAGSGFEQIDAFFQNYLAKGLRIGEVLPPGFYRIKIGP